MKTQTAINVLPIGHRSLIDMVAKLRNDFSNTRKELRQTNSENDRLKRELAKCQSHQTIFSEFDLPSLRRAVAFHCHPDRGGSEATMSQINTLFDFLAGMERSPKPGHRNCAQGGA